MTVMLAEDGSRIALRCTIDRLRREEEEADRSYKRWQEAVRESDFAWGNLAAVEESYNTLRKKLAEIENSKEYRSLQVDQCGNSPSQHSPLSAFSGGRFEGRCGFATNCGFRPDSALHFLGRAFAASV